ncbi:hypothetical protein HPC37_06530 [Pasteurellaceae bacterium 20609_3]|uniref:hypothetical protein n=1 Tax=Spirabiliibacterium mucosae TaxID=28156 RepID=UPI001AAE0C7B|nr:hypothetical protein [Spirabiliibacterium mucosae]MBE2898466.1 hypothetical protein [Spirabiliibacterium mucosae]
MQVNYYQHKASAKKQNQDALFNGENILQQKFAIGNIFIQDEPFLLAWLMAFLPARNRIARVIIGCKP